MIQEPLHFENKAPLAANADPETSHLAARKLTARGRRDTDKRRVLEALRRFPFSTSAELAHCAGLDRHMVARRLPDLERDGFVRKTGVRVCMVNKSLATIWRPK